jgi:hypothetical protein
LLFDAGEHARAIKANRNGVIAVAARSAAS